MESNQLNNTSREDAIIEALTLTCEVNVFGTKTYKNKEGRKHRTHGPAVIWPSGIEFWYKNGKCHREDGPAITFVDGTSQYWIDNKELTKYQFIQWQKKNGIKPIE